MARSTEEQPYQAEPFRRDDNGPQHLVLGCTQEEPCTKRRVSRPVFSLLVEWIAQPGPYKGLTQKAFVQVVRKSGHVVTCKSTYPVPRKRILCKNVDVTKDMHP